MIKHPAIGVILFVDPNHVVVYARTNRNCLGVDLIDCGIMDNRLWWSFDDIRYCHCGEPNKVKHNPIEESQNMTKSDQQFQQVTWITQLCGKMCLPILPSTSWKTSSNMGVFKVMGLPQ